mmetsp:Transcript_30781/g.89396  ORF Transcript_30781/g.89396 Transcript_30781/m.89396 type:complete len:236 (-) Transcript_30781:334-1041(-)
MRITALLALRPTPEATAVVPLVWFVRPSATTRWGLPNEALLVATTAVFVAVAAAGWAVGTAASLVGVLWAAIVMAAAGKTFVPATSTAGAGHVVARTVLTMSAAGGRPVVAGAFVSEVVVAVSPPGKSAAGAAAATSAVVGAVIVLAVSAKRPACVAVGGRPLVIVGRWRRALLMLRGELLASEATVRPVVSVPSEAEVAGAAWRGVHPRRGCVRNHIPAILRRPGGEVVARGAR